MDLKDVVCGCGLDSSGIGYGVVVGCSENGNTFLGSISCTEFLD